MQTIEHLLIRLNHDDSIKLAQFDGQMLYAVMDYFTGFIHGKIISNLLEIEITDLSNKKINAISKLAVEDIFKTLTINREVMTKDEMIKTLSVAQDAVDQHLDKMLVEYVYRLRISMGSVK